MCADGAKRVGHMPRQQLIDALDRMIGDALKDVG
jgi:hypothetical protein